MKKLRYLIVAGTLAVSVGAMAVPAKRITFVAEQPDGSQVTLTRAGDEFNKYYLTDDNQVVVGSKDSGYYFAKVDEASGRMIASSVKAANASDRNDTQIAFVNSLKRSELSAAMAVSASMSRIASGSQQRTYVSPMAQASSLPQSGIGLFPGASYPCSGSPKGLVILVQYTDVKFDTKYNAGDYFKRMLTEKDFSDYNATGSAVDWFTDASNGQFTPQFDVFGPVTLPNNMAYYGGNDYLGNDLRPEEMVIDGCRLLDSQINFKDYDTDDDGYVDNVFVFYAGLGEASSMNAENTVWPHQWEISAAGKSLVLDGVRISRYACTNEMVDGVPDGIGTFVHEFSHVMGLPDLYHTSDYATYTPGEWSVMDLGPYNNDGRTPPTYSIFERNALGWINPIVLDRTPQTIELANILNSNEGCIIPTSKDTEFFLLENRQHTGWDTYLPGHGMLIWHVDYVPNVWYSNSVNNDRNHQYVDIEEANNNSNGSYPNVKKNWAFPGDAGAYTSFTDDTNPGMKTWGGQSLQIPITEIAENGGIISFNVCGGKSPVEAPVAQQPDENQIGENYFIASWTPVADAVDYLITVNSIGEVIPVTDSNDFGTGNAINNPEGWDTSHVKSYTTAGDYGKASPSLKMEANFYVQTPKYDYPVSKISFWAKGQNQTSSTAILYAVDGSNEVKLTEFTNWNKSKGVIVEYQLERNDVYQLKLVYTKDNGGNLAVDDIEVVTATAGEAVVPRYNKLSTSGATSLRVDALPEGKTEFSYTVVAVNAEGTKSPESNKINVHLKASGVGQIEADDVNAPVEYYNLQGVRVINPGSGIYLRRQGSKVEKVVI